MAQSRPSANRLSALKLGVVITRTPPGFSTRCTVRITLNGSSRCSIVSNITLEKKAFGVNKQLLMTIENRGSVLASARFKILGEGERFSGKVNFSEEEAAGKSEE